MDADTIWAIIVIAAIIQIVLIWYLFSLLVAIRDNTKQTLHAIYFMSKRKLYDGAPLSYWIQIVHMHRNQPTFKTYRALDTIRNQVSPDSRDATEALLALKSLTHEMTRPDLKEALDDTIKTLARKSSSSQQNREVRMGVATEACSKCGAAIKAPGRFCPSCGNSNEPRQ